MNGIRIAVKPALVVLFMLSRAGTPVLAQMPPVPNGPSPQSPPFSGEPFPMAWPQSDGRNGPGGEGSQGTSPAFPGTGTPGSTMPYSPGSAPGDPGTGAGPYSTAGGAAGEAGIPPGFEGAGAGGGGAFDPGGSLGFGGTPNARVGGLGSAPVMFGDQPPFSIPRAPRQPPAIRSTLTQKGGSTFPWLRGFKIADNQSPVPQDRVFFNFNNYNNLNYAVNRTLNIPVSKIQAYRYQFGFEKTFLGGMASIGVRDSINNLSARSPNPALAGTSTSLGDLNIFAKIVLLRFGDLAGSSAPRGFGGLFSRGGGTGGLISGGLSVTAPTGPSSFAGSKIGRGFSDTQLQPFIGYYFQFGDFYLHGFESINVPVDASDVTMLFTDIGIGYYLYRNENLDGFINGFAPTFEVHVNNPLNHRDVYNINDLAGSADVVDLTLGGNLLLGRRVLFSAGAATPVTGPRPFTVEALALLNVYFGGRRPRTTSLAAAPMLAP